MEGSGTSIDWQAFVVELPEAVLAFDEQERIVFANRGAEALLGRPRQALVGSSLSSLLTPRHLEPARAFCRRDKRGDDAPLIAPVRFREEAEIEVEWTCLNGHTADGTSLVIALLRRRPESVRLSSPVGGSTEQRVHQLVFEHAPIGIFHFDERGVITACNDRFIRIIGSTRQRIIGLSLPQLPDERVRNCLEEVIAGRAAGFDGDYASVTADKVTPVRAEFEPIIDDTGHVIGGVGLVEDASERRSAERRALQAERMASLGSLAAGVVHEIQNPLAFVVASLDLALRQVDAPPADATSGDEGKSALEVALANAREGAWRVATIVRDLKAFARADEEVRGPVDLDAAARTALKLVSNLLRHRTQVERAFGATRLVWGSESRLVQLLVNLLVNAAEALEDDRPERNLIRVATQNDDEGWVLLSIEDNGRGVAPAMRDRIFEPFFTDKPTGMGLGLAICHGIVSSLGGEITVEDRAPSGTRLLVRLPEAEPRTSRPPPPPPKRARALSGRILVVDDEERLAETIQMALSPPHEVDVRTNGRDVLALVDAGADYDVVLCDLMMPDLSGPELYEAVRVKNPALAKRFVFLTGGAFTTKTRDFLHAVENPRLEKPFDLATLEALVSRCLAGDG